MKVPSCGACALFHGDKCLLSHLRALSSNKEAPYRYRCETPWCQEGTATSNTTTKRKSGGRLFPIVVDTATITPPPKKKRASQPPNNTTIVSVAPAVTAEFPIRSPEDPDSLTTYLMKSMSLKEEAVESLSRSNKTLEEEVQILQDRNHFLNETTTGLEKLVWQVRHQLDESDKQVTYLKRVIQKKVAALKVVLDLQRASDAATETLQAELTDAQSGLTAFQGQRLAELCIEKNLVAFQVFHCPLRLMTWQQVSSN